MKKSLLISTALIFGMLSLSSCSSSDTAPTTPGTDTGTKTASTSPTSASGIETSNQVVVAGEIKSDSNFAKLPTRVSDFISCMSTKGSAACESFLATDDDAISGMADVKTKMPQLEKVIALVEASSITWDQPKGHQSTQKDEDLYILSGKGKVKQDGSDAYVLYKLVSQNKQLFVYSLQYSPNPIEDAAY